jgi:HK97 family phage prohead protease
MEKEVGINGANGANGANGINGTNGANGINGINGAGAPFSQREVIINSSRLNCFKFRILTSGIDTEQFRRNPVLLWMHDRTGLPIGRIENLRVDGDNLIGAPVFDENDDFAKKIKAKWDAGFLNMVSAGLDPIETSADPAMLVDGQQRATVVKSKLIEVSIVDIGANDDALALYDSGKILNLSLAADFSKVPEIGFKNNLNDNLINENEMKIVALKLGLPETATEAEILTRIGALQLSAQSAETLRAEVELQRNGIIESEVEAAIKAKRLTADKKEHFVALGKSVGIDSLRTTLELMSPAAKPTDFIVPGVVASGATGEKKWKDLEAGQLIELRKDNPEEYRKLYKAEYGFLPENV